MFLFSSSLFLRSSLLIAAVSFALIPAHVFADSLTLPAPLQRAYTEPTVTPLDIAHVFVQSFSSQTPESFGRRIPLPTASSTLAVTPINTRETRISLMKEVHGLTRTIVAHLLSTSVVSPRP